jgi:MFS transporter, ACS family, tartrate transporter
MPDAPARMVLRRVAWRLTPVLALTYVVAQIDRVNVSFAALTMNADLGFSASVYGLGAGLFFVGYLLLQVPMNLAIARFGAGRVIAGLMVAWGIASAATALVGTPAEFYVVRLLVGAAESGVYPGMMLYLTYWFPAAQRATAVGLVALSVPIAGLLGSPLSGFILDHTHGLAGLASWQWLFILEGLPVVLLAPLVLAVLTDRPARAAWLSPAERDFLTATLAAEAAAQPPAAHAPWREVLGSTRVWLLAALYFLFAGGLIGSLFWLPRAVAHAAPGISAETVGWIVGAPYLLFGAATVWWGRRSDRLRERRWHTFAPAALGALGLAVLPFVQGPWAALGALCLYLGALGGAFSACWGLITAALPPRLAPVGIALVNSAGSLGAFGAIYVVGPLVDATGSLAPGLVLLAAAVALGGALALTRRWET